MMLRLFEIGEYIVAGRAVAKVVFVDQERNIQDSHYPFVQTRKRADERLQLLAF